MAFLLIEIPCILSDWVIKAISPLKRVMVWLIGHEVFIIFPISFNILKLDKEYTYNHRNSFIFIQPIPTINHEHIIGRRIHSCWVQVTL